MLLFPLAFLILSSSADAAALPSRVVDAHHHFFDTNQNFSSFIQGLIGPNVSYLPQDYSNDVTDPLQAVGVEMSATAHLEILPDTPLGGPDEAGWIHTQVEQVKAIVGSCDLGDEAYSQECLDLMNASSPLLRGIRWIVDYVGPFNGSSATHVNTVRRDVDYLRGGDNGTVVPSFERGFAALADYGWSFDLQCAPEQLKAAADLSAKYPDIRVVINHLGKPRMVLGEDSNDEEPDQEELQVWREGMQAMANLPHVYVKLSMLGYAVPDWILASKRTAAVRDLVRETVEMFGPKRCMMALNWYLNPVASDSDGLGTVGPTAVEFVEQMSEWLEDYSEEDREWIFAKTAEEFYSIDYENDGSSGSRTTTVLFSGIAALVALAFNYLG